MRDMGVATSATTFGRSLGGAIGAALFGAILTARLATYLAEELSGVAGAAISGGEIDTNDVQELQALEEPARSVVLTAYTNAINDIFLYAIPIILLALVVVLFLKEIPLRTTQMPAGETAPRSDDTGPAAGRSVRTPLALMPPPLKAPFPAFPRARLKEPAASARRFFPLRKGERPR